MENSLWCVCCCFENRGRFDVVAFVFLKEERSSIPMQLCYRGFHIDWVFSSNLSGSVQLAQTIILDCMLLLNCDFEAFRQSRKKLIAQRTQNPKKIIRIIFPKENVCCYNKICASTINWKWCQMDSESNLTEGYSSNTCLILMIYSNSVLQMPKKEIKEKPVRQKDSCFDDVLQWLMEASIWRP